MKKLTLFLALMLGACHTVKVQAQEAGEPQRQDVLLHVLPQDTAGMQVFLYEMGDDDSSAPMQAVDGTTLKQSLGVPAHGMYNFVYVSMEAQAQYATPLFFDGTVPAELSLQMQDGCPRLTATTSSKKKADKERVAHVNKQLDAIFSFNQVYFKQSREVWTQAQQMGPAELKAMLSTYDEALQKIASDPEIGEGLKQYVDVWNYLLKSEAVTVYNRYHTSAHLSADEAIGLPASQKLDTPLALLLNGALNTAAQALPKGTLQDRLSYIHEHYHCAEIKAGIQQMVVNSYIRAYKFDKGYQEGLSVLEEATQKYGLDSHFVDMFKERVAAVPGAAFPDVALIDSDGQKVSLDKFRGKYVYIDLWASWCVPCIKEVPYLQELEKSLQNPNVVFVSISTDSTEKPWRDRMKQHNMHGNQWLNTDGKLCDKLNVSGIPHFLIYDKDGHLHTYSAPRPSTGEALKSILEGLK